jgi:putative peptidoglycan binding protein
VKLFLTSPWMEGPQVREAQRLLATNPYGKFLQGEIDGVFGPDTHRAVYRAKWWVGYTDERCNHVFGEYLAALLSERRMLSRGQQARREARLRRGRRKPLRLRALADMIARIGEREEPDGSNRAPASLWYGLIGPWCAMSVTKSYVTAGSTAFVRGSRFAYVPFMVAEAAAGSRGLAITYRPQPGDVVCFDWEGNGDWDHTGLFEQWLTVKARFQSVEGNTGNAQQRHVRDYDPRRTLFVHVGR